MRDLIVTHLGTVVESTAKTIAFKIGAEHRDVSLELNRLHADGLVQREKRDGAGNEYWYRSLPQGSVASSASAKPEVTEDPMFAEVQPAREQRSAAGGPIAALADSDADVKHERDELRVENESLRASLAKWRQNCADLEAQIDKLTIVDARFPAVFVTVGRYATPKRHATLEKAQKRASALVKSEKETEVLVLEPVGRVVRGTQWVGA